VLSIQILDTHIDCTLSNTTLTHVGWGGPRIYIYDLQFDKKKQPPIKKKCSKQSTRINCNLASLSL